jgi:hypothetical protein
MGYAFNKHRIEDAGIANQRIGQRTPAFDIYGKPADDMAKMSVPHADKAGGVVDQVDRHRLMCQQPRQRGGKFPRRSRSTNCRIEVVRNAHIKSSRGGGEFNSESPARLSHFNRRLNIRMQRYASPAKTVHHIFPRLHHPGNSSEQLLQPRSLHHLRRSPQRLGEIHLRCQRLRKHLRKQRLGALARRHPSQQPQPWREQSPPTSAAVAVPRERYAGKYLTKHHHDRQFRIDHTNVPESTRLQMGFLEPAVYRSGISQDLQSSAPLHSRSRKRQCIRTALLFPRVQTVRW